VKHVVGLAFPMELVEVVDRIRQFESRSSFIGRVVADALGIVPKTERP